MFKDLWCYIFSHQLITVRIQKFNSTYLTFPVSPYELFDKYFLHQECKYCDYKSKIMCDADSEKALAALKQQNHYQKECIAMRFIMIEKIYTGKRGWI